MTASVLETVGAVAVLLAIVALVWAAWRYQQIHGLQAEVERRTQAEAGLKATTAALEAERKRFRNVLDLLPAYVVLLAPDYHVPFANRFFRERFGESHGRRCFEYLFERTQPCEVCESYRVLKTGEPHHWEWLGPDGRNYDIYDFPFREADGSTLILEMGIDITENKRAREELERSNDDLQQYAYVASHDLQEPLRAVSTFTSLLGQRYRGRLDADADDYIGFIVDGAKRMHHLVNDLLDYSRVRTRAAQLEPTNCETVLENTLADLASTLEETGGRVTHDPLPVVWADATQLGQVFQNLIANGLKFHREEPPRVHVSAEKLSGEWRFAVRDDGIGIEPEYAQQIFRIFQRLHGAGEYEGTGIGLAIAKKIVDRHCGQIWMESEPGQGSTFYFTIPRKE